MQVQVQANGLERRLTVALPLEQVNKEIENRLKSLSRRAKVDGFRAGKVPFKVAERKWGYSVRQEVHNDLIKSSFSLALSQEKLRPAGTPQFELSTHIPGAGLEYTAIFEVYPEFEVKIPDNMQVTKPVTTITESDIDVMVEKLRNQRATWVAVERAAQKGDRVVIDFEGRVEGGEFEGNKASAFPVVLGSGSLIAGFEDSLIGAKAGDQVGFDIRFPADYRVTDLAGKPAHFDTKLLSVNAAQLPELNDDFIKNFGIQDGGIDAFRAEVKGTMERELDQAIKDRVKGQVLDALLAANTFDLPKALIDEEIARMREQGGKQAGDGMETFARRRVALGLIIAEIIKKNQFKADPAKVRAVVESQAATYERPEEVVQWYYARRERLSNVEALLLEDQAVEWMVQQGKVTEQVTPFAELVGK